MFCDTYTYISSCPYKEEGIASTIEPNSEITLAEVIAEPVTSITSESAANKVENPSNSPALALTPCQIFCSVFSATLAATWLIKKSLNFGGNLSNEEYPICTAFQSERKSFLHSSILTWNSSG